jgi:sulfite reductase (NADPH) hemoprotein beta-component
MTLQIVTANRLIDGIVVYLAANGGWSEDLNAGLIARDEEAAKAALAAGEQAARERKVVAPYLIDVREADGAVVPVRYRELLRAAGPSSHPEFNRPQAGIRN